MYYTFVKYTNYAILNLWEINIERLIGGMQFEVNKGFVWITRNNYVTLKFYKINTIIKYITASTIHFLKVVGVAFENI